MKFIHTSDWQLGVGFGQIPGDGGALLRTQRIKTLETIGQVAKAKGAEFIVVAGDIFDSHGVGSDTIVKACAALRQIALPVILITGNHDGYREPDNLYERKCWKEHCPDNVTICQTVDPVVLDQFKVVIFPCPLSRKLVIVDPTEHLAQVAATFAKSDYLRIGLAHGPVHGFEIEDGEGGGGVIDAPGAVKNAQLDYLALGDWHGTLKVGDRIWYSGTPETDRFRNNDSGNVLLVSLDGKQSLPVVESICTTAYEWLMENRNIQNKDDVESLKDCLKGIDRPAGKLLRIELSGVLNMELLHELQDVIENQRAALLYLRDYVDILLEPSPEEIAGISEGGFVRNTVEKLQAIMKSAQGEAAEDAKLALQIMYQYSKNEVVL